MNIVYVFIDDARYLYNGLEISSEKFNHINSAYNEIYVYKYVI